MTADEILAGQIEYYRRRAGEYDVTAYGDVGAARARIEAIVGRMDPTGAVCEIACGTGLWTEALARTAHTVTAVDAAPEAIEIARQRVSAGNVHFVVADVIDWPTTTRFDVVFFAAWLSHVPDIRFDDFWRSLGDRLAEGGRVLFVDEHRDERDKEHYRAGSDEVAVRRLTDGTEHSIVKNYVDPDVLVARLHGLGWRCDLWRDGADWICGDARRLTAGMMAG